MIDRDERLACENTTQKMSSWYGRQNQNTRRQGQNRRSRHSTDIITTKHKIRVSKIIQDEEIPIILHFPG